MADEFEIEEPQQEIPLPKGFKAIQKVDDKPLPLPKGFQEVKKKEPTQSPSPSLAPVTSSPTPSTANRSGFLDANTFGTPITQPKAAPIPQAVKVKEFPKVDMMVAAKNTAKKRSNSTGRPLNLELEKVNKDIKDGKLELTQDAEGNPMYGRSTGASRAFASGLLTKMMDWEDAIDQYKNGDDPKKLAQTLEGQIKRREDAKSLNFGIGDFFKATLDPTSLAQSFVPNKDDPNSQLPYADPTGLNSVAHMGGNLLPYLFIPKGVGVATESVVSMTAPKMQELYQTELAELQKQGVPEDVAKQQAALKARNSAPLAAAPQAALNTFLMKGTNNPASKTFLDDVSRLLTQPVKLGAMGAAAEGVTQGIQAAQGFKTDDVLKKMGEAGKSWFEMTALLETLMHLPSIPKHLKAATKELAAQPEVKPIVDNMLENIDPVKADEIRGELSNYEAARKKVEGLVPEKHISTFAGLTEKRDALEKSKEGKTKALTEPIDAEIKSIDERLSAMQKSGNVNEVDDLTGETIHPVKLWDELSAKERAGIIVPKEIGDAEVIEMGEGENKKYKVKSTYKKGDGRIQTSHDIETDGKEYSDKSKAQVAADEALAKHYYENAMPDTDKPIAKNEAKQPVPKEESATEVLQPTETKEPPITETIETVQPTKTGQVVTEETVTPPPEPPVVEGSGKKEPAEFGNKAILKRLSESENIKPEIREKFKDDLRYKVKSHEEARTVAKEVINEYGHDESVSLAEAGKFHGDVNSMIFGEALDQLYKMEQEAKTPEEKTRIASQWADVAIRYDEAGRSGGRFISAIGDFYKKSPLGIKLKEEANRNEAFKEWFKNKESGFKEVWEAIKEEPEFKDIVSKEVQSQLKKERTEVRQKRRKNIDDFFEKAKFKGDATYATIIPPDVINGGLEAMKQAFLAGESVLNAVETAVEHISKTVKDWDKDKFRKEWEGKLKGLSEENIKPIRRDKRIEYLKKELERIRKRSPKDKRPETDNKRKASDEEQILLDEIESEQVKWDAERDAARDAANDYQKMETERNRQLKRVVELNEKIEILRKGKLPETKVREPKIDTPEIEQLKVEKSILEKAVRESIAQENKMKDLDAELQRLKDRKEREPKSEKVREITEQERQIRDEIDAERKAWNIEKNVSKLQEELQRIKDRQKKVTTPQEKRELTDTEKSLLDEIRSEKQKWAKEVEPERRVREALKAAQKSLEEYERRISQRDISKKESTTAEPPQLKQLRDKRDAKRKEYEEMKKQMTAPTKEELDARNKERILERFRKKLKGLSDKEKEDVIRKSFKKLVENGALEYEDFKEIIKQTLGLGELSEAERAKIDQYVKDINEVQDLAEAARTERTDASLNKYREGAKKAEKSATALGEIVYNKPRIINRLTSLMQLNTLGIPSLINNPIFNIFNQAFVRFPKAVQMSILDKGIQLGGKLFGKDWKPNTDVLSAQKPFFQGVGEGGKQSVEQMFTGLTNKDYFQKEVYTSQIRPFSSLKDIYDFAKGEKHLSKAQIADKALQGTFGIPAEIVARTLNIGDKPQRFATEKATAKVIANQYGLKGMDEKLFMEFPKQEAYRLEKAKGTSDELAMKRAEEIEQRIISEGEESTFQQDNIVNNILTGIGEQYDKIGDKNAFLKGMGQLGKVFKTMNLPFVKIPLNAFWSYFNLVNPEVAMAQSVVMGVSAAYKKSKGIDGWQKDFEQSKKWMAHASTGMGLLAITATLANNGVVTGDNTANDAKKEREGEKYYERQHSMDMNKLMAFLQGKNPEDAQEGLKVDLKWFGVVGNAANLQANKYEEMTPEQRANGIKLMEDMLGDMKHSAMEVFETGVFSNAAGLANAFGRGGVYADSYLINLVNMGTNIVNPAMFAQVSRAKLPYEYTTKADTFLDQIKNNMSARTEWGRKLANKYPPSKISMWGDEMKRNDDWALRWFSMSKANPDAFAKPIYDDYKETGDTNFFPPSVKNELNGQKLTTQETFKLETLVGQARKKLIAPYINDYATLPGVEGKYSTLTKEQKLKALEILYKQGYDEGKAQFQAIHPKYASKEPDWETNDKKAEEEEKFKELREAIKQ